MSDEEFLITLRQAFLVEAQEHLHAITSGLLSLEKNPSPDQKREVVENTFREAHSLKGAARAVARADIESLCQEMETIFADWKDHAPQITPAQFDVLNRTVDLVGRLIMIPDVSHSAAEVKNLAGILKELQVIASAKPATDGGVVAYVAPLAAVPAVSQKETARPRKARPPRSKAAQAPVAVVAPSERSQAQTPAPAAEAEKLQVSETIRVPMAKMDALLLQAEEMISVKLTSAQHATDLRELGDGFEAWNAQWSRAREIMRHRSDLLNGEQFAGLREFLEWNQEFVSALGKKVASLAKTSRQDERAVGALVDDLLEDAKKLVMLPCATVLDLFPKQVRDLARDEGKQVDLVVQGREVELDKRILEEIKSPLIHLVRNAIDHGIEEPSERARAGKREKSTLTISVSQAEGNKALIQVSDDGGGIHIDKLKTTAVRRGAISAEEAARMTDSAATALIFHSGISTSPIVTEVSGRGLGMAIVREKVMKLGGTIEVVSTPGKGTSFRILLPVTLATFKGILVRAGGQTFVIPVASAERIKRFRLDEIKTVEGRETVALDGCAVAFVRLADVLRLPKRATEGGSQGFVESVVIGSGDGRVALGVEAVLNEQEVLVKNLGRPLLRVPNIAAATVLGSGTPVLILNTSDLLKSAVHVTATISHAPVQSEDAEPKASRILVADDSVTSRMLIKNILETSGYTVETAMDGMEALTSLKSRHFDLLVSDVEMPRMNGFDLTSSVRSDKKLNELPVVLVTALSSRADRERGIDVGANAYIVKSSFDQSDLLSVVGNLI